MKILKAHSGSIQTTASNNRRRQFVRHAGITPSVLFLVVLLLMLYGQKSFAQVAINTTNPTPTCDASAVLDLQSASRGLLLPRLVPGSIASPAFGLFIYNSTSSGGGLSFYDGTSWNNLSSLSSPVFTGTVTIPTPFTLGATSVTTTGTQLNYLNAATGTTGTTSTNLVYSTSPTLVTPSLGAATATSINGNTITTGTGILTLGAGKTFTASNTLTLTGTDGSTLNIGSGGTLGANAYTGTAYAPLASPTFTGTLTIPTPFTLGATSVTTIGTQLNYLNAATGTTGTTSTNLVYSTSPTLVTPSLGAATATSINGNTITTGTGILTLGAGKTFTASNTLTLTGTDGSTLNIGSGGTLGANAYTGTAYAPLASPTFTGTPTLPTGTIATTQTAGDNSTALATTAFVTTADNLKANIASPTFTGTVIIPTPFTIGAVSMSSTGTQLNYLNAVSGTTGTTSTNLVFSTSPTLVTPSLGVATATSINGNTITTGTGILTLGAGKTFTASNTLTLTGTDGSTLNIGSGGTLGANAYTGTAYAPLASPTFTGTPTLPTGTIATTQTAGDNSTALATTAFVTTADNLKANIASPTFTGTVIIPTPFTIGAVSMSTTGTQLNYLNAATGTTGTTSSNIVFSASPTFTGTVNVAAITASGAITPSQTVGIVGTTTNNNVQAGSVGEYITTSVAPNTTVITSGVAITIVTQSLTAGDWDVWGVINYTPTNTTSITVLAAGLNTTTNTLGAQDTYQQDSHSANVPGTTTVITQTVPMQRILLSGTSNVYLVASCTFSASTLQGGGTIFARRVR